MTESDGTNGGAAWSASILDPLAARIKGTPKTGHTAAFVAHLRASKAVAAGLPAVSQTIVTVVALDLMMATLKGGELDASGVTPYEGIGDAAAEALVLDAHELIVASAITILMDLKPEHHPRRRYPELAMYLERFMNDRKLPWKSPEGDL